MTTKLNKPVVRETSLVWQMGNVLVTLVPPRLPFQSKDSIQFRVKGKKDVFSLPLDEVFHIAKRRALVGGK